MTKSGYPFVVKLWKRGQPLDQAKEVFRGTENDVGVRPETLNDGQGHHDAFMNVGVNTFESALFPLDARRRQELALPGKAKSDGLLHNQLIVTLNQDWKPDGLNQTFPQGPSSRWTSTQ